VKREAKSAKRSKKGIRGGTLLPGQKREYETNENNETNGR
jgi:hypothetical protein